MPASLSGLFPGLIDSLASGHSFFFEELSVPLRSRPKGASGSARERENLQSLLHQEGGPLSAFSPVTAQTDLTAH